MQSSPQYLHFVGCNRSIHSKSQRSPPTQFYSYRYDCTHAYITNLGHAKHTMTTLSSYSVNNSTKSKELFETNHDKY